MDKVLISKGKPNDTLKLNSRCYNNWLAWLQEFVTSVPCTQSTNLVVAGYRPLFSEPRAKRNLRRRENIIATDFVQKGV